MAAEAPLLQTAVDSTSTKCSAGVLSLELCGAGDIFPHVDRPCEMVPATFNGSMEEFLEHNTAEGKEAEGKAGGMGVPREQLMRQMKNNVKKCPNCGKPNAFTLSTCNQCGHSLTEVPMSHTNNVFTGFIYGVAKGPFPFTVSMRHQSESLMVFDDLLALAPCHVNCIPSNVYCPDVRCLFEKPEQGLKMLQGMWEAAWGVVSSQFIGNSKWLEKISKGSSAEQLKKHVVAGLNFPPSQYQLHLQYILPPLMPFHYGLYRQGVHFTPGRFFPYEYVIAALQLCVDKKAPLVGASKMPIEEVISHFESLGLSYADIHREFFARVGASHNELAKWQPSDFKFAALDNDRGSATILHSDTMAVVAGQDINAIKNADKLTLQNYGRPYSAAGKPTGTFYKYAKTKILPEFIA